MVVGAKKQQTVSFVVHVDSVDSVKMESVIDFEECLRDSPKFR